MSELLSQLSNTIALRVATAAPILTAVRIGVNRHVSGLLWRNDLIVTADQSLPAAASYDVVLSSGALISAVSGPRDPGHNLACLRLAAPAAAALPDAAPAVTIGALVLALGANFDGSPTVRLTTIHGFPRAPGFGPADAMTLDLAGGRVDQGGLVLDAEGRLLGMTSGSPDGDAVVVPHHVIGQFVAAATNVPTAADAAPMSPAETAPAAEFMPEVTRRGWLGVSLQPITVPDNLARRAGQRTARQVVSMTRGGPADRAGLRTGDVLLALDGSTISGNHALRAFLVPERIDSEVEVRLMRDGLIHTTILLIAAQPES